MRVFSFLVVMVWQWLRDFFLYKTGESVIVLTLMLASQCTREFIKIKIDVEKLSHFGPSFNFGRYVKTFNIGRQHINLSISIFFL